MSSTSIGFNVPSSDSVALFDFDVLIDGHSLRAENASTQAAWSPSSSVDIRAEVDIDLSAALSSASLTGDNGEPVGILGLVIAWKSTRTNLHGASSPVEVVDGLNRVTDLTPVWWTPDIQPSRAGRKVIYHHVQVLRTVQTRCRGPLRKQ